MAVKLGSAIFEDHISIELIPGKWTDTFIFPVRHDRMLSPWAFAEVVKAVIRPLKKLRRSASLWVPVLAPGKWYFEEVKYALRSVPIPVAVTQNRKLPALLDFSKHPGIYDSPCPCVAPTAPLPGANLKKNVLRSLLQMARFTVAFTNEIECSLMIGDKTARKALKELAAQGYIELHPNDSDIDSHLIATKRIRKVGRRKSVMWNGEHWPYWRIKRHGVSAALRAWGVPAGVPYHYHLERTRLLNSVHRRRSRQWPRLVSRALPHAKIYAGWNEISIPKIRLRPDALAWGTIQGAETLFWLEVESGISSAQYMLEQTTYRWARAKKYAEVVGVQLVFVLLGSEWVRQAVRISFIDVPQTCAVIVASTKRRTFGKLPYPKWGEVTVE
jgi:hypothetical protein